MTGEVWTVDAKKPREMECGNDGWYIAGALTVS